MEKQNEETKTASRRDWRQLLEEAFEWTLNAAAEVARNHPQEIAAVERVRAHVRKRFAQSEYEQLSANDVLLTFALLAAASAGCPSAAGISSATP